MQHFQARRISHGARFGEISLNFKTMELRRADQPVGLTLQEFKVLKFFVSRPELVVSRQRLIRAVWRKRKRSSDRTVDNHIARLRQKIESDPAHPVHLLTVHGVGYKFVPQGLLRPYWQEEFELGTQGRQEKRKLGQSQTSVVRVMQPQMFGDRVPRSQPRAKTT
jgi:DNA-binding winged helix-turn-helix (wHTH) protein